MDKQQQPQQQPQEEEEEKLGSIYTFSHHTCFPSQLPSPLVHWSHTGHSPPRVSITQCVYECESSDCLQSPQKRFEERTERNIEFVSLLCCIVEYDFCI